MSGSLTDWLARLLGLRPQDRRILLTAALGGGFGAIFGVPLAGAFFGLEVQRVSWHGRQSGTRLYRFAATLTASVVGDQVVRSLGYHHPVLAQLHVALAPSVLARAAVAGIAFGLISVLFVRVTGLIRTLSKWAVPWAPIRPALGGALVVGAVALVGRSYLGLSLPLIDDALSGGHTDLRVPVLKLAFTALCIGSGFVGGEVTPLFVIGATLGSAIAPGLGLPPALGAAMGFVAVFAGAANTPLACIVMGAELFGTGAIAPVAVACMVAYLCSGRSGIYPAQQRAERTGQLAFSRHHITAAGARWRTRRSPQQS